MKWSNSLITLVVLLLILGALVVRNMDLPLYAFSVEEITTELNELCDQYAELSAREATETEWEAFEQEVREKTKPLIADLEKRPKQRGSHALYQVIRYDLPEAIASRGRVPVIDREMGLEIARASAARLKQAANTQEPERGVDLCLVGMVVLDGGLLIAIGYMLFWPVHKRFFVPKDLDSMLGQLNKRIERNPDSVRYLGVRARLLAEAGRHEEAVADIDRILEEHAHGVDVNTWRQFRETVVQKATVRKETRENEQRA